MATALVSVIATAVWGRSATLAAATFGGVATAVQLFVARTMSRTGVSNSLDHVKTYGVGVAFRLVGVVILAVVVSLDRTTFPPLPSAAGYLGAVLSLLYLETRLSR